MKRSAINYFPLYGCFSTGLIYGAIGVIAMLSFFKYREGGADENSLLSILNETTVGRIFVLIILLGTICYIIWRIYEVINDPYEYGNDWQGIAKRTGIALSTIADMLIAYSAIQVFFGIATFSRDGQPQHLRKMTTEILELNRGDWIVILLGITISITAIIQFLYGVTRGYKERIDIAQYNHLIKNTINFLAWVGYAARGIILGIVGSFFIKAGILNDGHLVVNTDKAFDFVGDHIGHAYFILLAIGTFCYGLFMFIQGFTYNTDKE